MNKKRRLWITVAVGIVVILIVISVIAYRLYNFMVLEFGHPPPWPSNIDLTATSIIATNQLVETLISQTQTADIHECFCQTITPEPKTMTAIAGITATYGISSVMTQVRLSGATYEFTPTPTPIA